MSANPPNTQNLPSVSRIHIGYQSAAQRNPEEEGGEKRFPSLKTYRCNLIALSQVYNLFFVACADTIHVYQPNFPDQFLTEWPNLILKPPVSGPNLTYQVDHQCPHSINRLHVDHLGDDEIILLACDDGDVLAYRTALIQEAVDQKSITDIRPFLHHNVQLSVWGLAVHRQARIIAISSNTHHVTVIVFALTEDAQSEVPQSRMESKQYRLEASANIPSVSFDNSGMDPEGRWLLSNAIDGYVFLWDLHDPAHVAKKLWMGFCCGPSPMKRDCACLAASGGSGIAHAAWAAIFIDPRGCFKCPSSTGALGPHYKSAIGGDNIWVIKQLSNNESTSSGSSVTGQSSGSNTASAVVPTGAQMNIPGNASETLASDEEEDEDEVDDFIEESQPTVPLAFAPPASVTPALAPNPWAAAIFNAQAPPPNPNGPNGPNGLFFYVSGEESSDDDEPVMLQANWMVSATYPHGHTIRTPTKKNPITEHLWHDMVPPFTLKAPIMIVNKQDIFLVQPLTPDDQFKGQPFIALDHPQRDVQAYTTTTDHSRLCFVTQIPELGIVLVGSPSGFVSMLTLTQYAVGKKVIYGFRYDPERDLFPLLEEMNFQPDQLLKMKLAGIAVSPVQGMQDPVMGNNPNPYSPAHAQVHGRRRWRLLLYYQDHSLRTYELSLNTEETIPETVVV